MERGLDMDFPPGYRFSSFRYFSENEKHVTRVCEEDVLLLVFDGTLRFTENGVPAEVSEGNFYIQQKGILQEGPLPSDSPQYYYIHFDGRFAEAENALPTAGTADIGSLFPRFRELDFLQSSRGSKTEQNGVFYSILASLKQGLEGGAQQRVSRRVISLFAEDLCHPFSLDELAQQCGYSKNHIIHLFKNETGETPYSYLTKLRMDAAKTLLKNSELPASRISIQCGFENYVNLYKRFVKEEGCTPLEWRDAHRR